MQYLPLTEVDFKDYQKLNTYLMLSHMGCPVLKSVIIKNNLFSPKDINDIAQYLGSEFCTIRYQYIKPNSQPVRGGNKIRLQYNTLIEKVVPDTILWLLEETDRLKNNYGINMFFNCHQGFLLFECVGKGFDVSDLNRGDINPHQSILFQLPINYGWNNEWWKYVDLHFIPNVDFEASKDIRLKKLFKLGFDVDKSIFNNSYIPLTLSQIEKLMEYAQFIYSSLSNEKEFVVSCSIDYNYNIIFWDIQTPAGKRKILGGK